MSPITYKVFRDKVKVPKANYFVEYCPAVSGMTFANLQLVFPSKTEMKEIPTIMEQELTEWLQRYPVPIFASSFDEKEDLIRLPESSHLMGYLDEDGKIKKKWGQYLEKELPAAQVESCYLADVYKDIPFRYAKDVRDRVRRESRFSMAVAYTIIVFTVVVPVLIELISMGFEWLGYLLGVLSIGKGCYEISKAFGWIKPSRREKEKAEKKSNMEHYYYHCQRNPEAFLRLKMENLENETVSRVQSEDAALRRGKGSK
jgi:hypothetical protein